MRVVQVLTQGGGGPADHAVDVAGGLADRGVDSHVVAPRSLVERVGTRHPGVTWHAHDVRSKHDVAGLATGARLLAALRPDVLHLQDRRAGWLGRGVAPALRRTAVVYTLHGVADGLAHLAPPSTGAAPRRRRDGLYYLHGERWVTQWSGCRVVSPSHCVAEFAVRHVGLDPARLDVVPNGVAVDRVDRDVVPRRTPRLVWVGALAPVKRPDLLLHAVAGLRRPVEVVLLGAGPEERAVRRLRDRLGLGGSVRLLGQVADPPGVLQHADAFVLTSAAESCPLALLQAMARGVPAVATAVGDVPRLLGGAPGREAGLLCPSGDATALTGALDRLLADPPAAASMGDRARARVEASYTLGRCVDGLLASYARAAA